MLLLEDTRQQAGKHDIKHKWFEEHGIEIRRCRLYVGDYTLPTNQSICIDTKQSCMELINDLQTDHVRFRDELLRAQEAGIKLYILVENDFQWISQKKNIFNTPVRCIKDLYRWKNPRAFIFKSGKQAYPNCAKGSWLAKCCTTCEEKYGCKFVFCKPDESAEIILKILKGEYADVGDR